MTASDEGAQLSTPAFWNDRYGAADTPSKQPTHEWFRGFESLRPWLSKYLLEAKPAAQDPSILHLGSGDSTVPHDLFNIGYKSQICVDFSSIVVEQMSERYKADTGVQWQCADVRSLPFSDQTVDVAFDKGTLDAMIFGSPWNPPEEVKENTSRYIKEVQRVLKDDGVFLYVTYRQPHFVKPLLNTDNRWNIKVETLSDGEGSFEYFGIVLRKWTEHTGTNSRLSTEQLSWLYMEPQ